MRGHMHIKKTGKNMETMEYLVKIITKKGYIIYIIRAGIQGLLCELFFAFWFLFILFEIIYTRGKLRALCRHHEKILPKFFLAFSLVFYRTFTAPICCNFYGFFLFFYDFC